MLQTSEFLFGKNKIKYVIDYPENFDETKVYPIIFYIHGHGFTWRDFSYLVENCPVRRERLPKDNNSIIVAPKCDNQTWISIFESLNAFIEYIVSRNYIDKKRVYLSGSSMGGYTDWLLLQVKKTFFAAAVICCGGGQYWAANLKTFNDIPIKAVHGRKDDTVLCRESEIMAKKINTAGGNCELIIHEDLGHDVWTRTFTDHNTYEWLAKQHR